MANQEDYLDKVWIKVINPDPNGSWVEEVLEKAAGSAKGPFAGVAPALKRVLRSKPSLEDLGRIARFVRYEAASKTLDALEHPGLAKGKVKGLQRQLADSKPGNGKVKVSEPEFIQSLWGIINPADDGIGLESVIASIAPAAAFGDVHAALKRLLKGGARLRDLGILSAWHRYEACYHTLRLMEEEGFRKASEIPGIHEILLGLDPSGKEGRKGSWPFLKKLD